MRQSAAPMIMHSIYFTLADPSEKTRQLLIEACQKFLSNHPGQIGFSVGTLAEDMRRDVNDLDFHVSVNMIFQNRAAHDQYQQAPRHEQFIKEAGDLSSVRRVFDSYLF